MAKGFKSGSGGVKEYKPSTLPPQVISLSVKGKYLAPTDNIEVTILFANIPTASREYLSEFVVAYDKGRIPQTPFEGKQVAIPKSASETVSLTFTLPIDYLGEVGFRVFPKNPDEMYQTVNFPNINSVMAKFAKFVKPTYTGQHAFTSDADYEYLEMYSGGELIVSEAVYDIHLVGGGGGGHYGGGGAGYTKTQKSVTLSGKYAVFIGAGGSSRTKGSPTYIDKVLQADGGDAPAYRTNNGGNGGSGGGAFDVNGGSNGQNGQNGDGGKGGRGQQQTTKDFAESHRTLRAGGGAGLNGYGGAGGGGNSQKGGTPHTGGGAGGGVGGVSAAGGSGIAIIRWKKAE